MSLFLLPPVPSLPAVSSLRPVCPGFVGFLRPSFHSPSGFVAVLAVPLWSSFVRGLAVAPSSTASVAPFAAWWAARLPRRCQGVVVRRGLFSVPVSLSL